MKSTMSKAARAIALCCVLVWGIAFAQAPSCFGQAPTQPPARAALAGAVGLATPHASDADTAGASTTNSSATTASTATNSTTSSSANASSTGSATSAAPSSQPGGTAESEVPAAVMKELEEMEKRIEELEAALKSRDTAASKSGDPSTAQPAADSSSIDTTAAAQQAAPAPAASATSTVAKIFEPQKQTQADPFSYADWTWLNGTPRTEDTPLATKYFTPEVRFDTNFMEDYNQPRDHTMGGSTESFRSDEIQLEQMSFGGDIHIDNVRGRVLTMFGLFSTTTPRNDGSAGVGQWNLNDAYKYFSEAWGGYHFNVNHGLNVDAGIFVSYIGLFSYYNFDNWTYQPSFVSSNTPWFFNGLRVQWFPTAHLKIEPWFINGWQSYAKFNGHPGLGGQLLWMPKEWFKLVANQYGYGEDNLGLPKTQRIHTDDSIEVRYYNDPESLGVSKMAFSLTGDAGCQYGGGITCTGGPNRESFVGWMLYDRMWFHKDKFGLTLGGGDMSNYGRYLTLLPPIDGAWAASSTPYFTENPGQKAHMWDSTVTLQYMPKQYITWWAEAGYRHSDIPYFAGRGGVTPPGGNNGLPQYFTCMSGATAGTNNLAAATVACGGAGNIWYPDLRRSEAKVS